ncbi:MAG: N-acetyl-alpha-D-glucosaminyl L-malate synthase BshA [Planctomycetota bacterium]|nr:N-acetyl-alpha-D-glucosaminyl L-malate synthase BshA [Planctomycetota bacterium]
MENPARRKLNIGIVCHPAYGGSGVVASELGLELAARGHQVHFFSHSLPFRVPNAHPNTFFHEVEVTSYPLFKYPPYTLALATKLAEVCRERPMDILHVHYAIPHAIAAYLCTRMLEPKQRPVTITTLHGTDITLVGLDSSFFEITRFSLDHSDGITAVSDQLAGETLQRFSTSRPVEIVPNFVDSEKFNPALRSESKRSAYTRPGEFLIGHVSNFRPVKRVLDVIRTFQLLHRNLPSHLLMIGEGVDLEPARNLAAELGIKEHVTFLGPVDKVPEVLSQLDLFLLPSEYESFGLAALEAMACGVPVVASRTGGLPEVVEDGVCGHLCEVSDVSAMATRAAEILGDEGKAAAFSAAARQRAKTLFDPAEIVGRYEDYYMQILEKNGVPAQPERNG